MFKPFQPDILRSKVSVFVELLSASSGSSPSRSSCCARASVRELELRHMRELLQSEARFREIVGIGDGRDHRRSTPTGTITLFNARGRADVRHDAAEAIGARSCAVLPRRRCARTCSTDLPVVRRRDAAAKARPAAEHPASLTGAPGERRGRSRSRRRCRCLDARGERTYTLIVRDISERVRARGGAARAGGVARRTARRAQAAERGAASSGRSSSSAR